MLLGHIAVTNDVCYQVMDSRASVLSMTVQ